VASILEDRMKIGWFIAPYKQAWMGPREYRYCAIEDFRDDIRDNDGNYKFTEIEKNNALICVRAKDNILNKIKMGSDVEFIEIEDPLVYWKPTVVGETTGKIIEVRPVEDLEKYLLKDTEWDDLKKEAERLAKEYDEKGYQKIDRGDWGITVQLLILLGKAGYGLDKVSTGTFPTTGVLDNFNRASATAIGGNWTTGKVWNTTGDYGIVSDTLAYNPDQYAWYNMYYNVSTYGADSEAYWTLSTNTPDSTADAVGLDLRIANPGNSFDGYEVDIDYTAATPVWGIFRVDNGTSTSLDSLQHDVANGDKMGAEIIGWDITGYHYTGGAWSAVLSEPDATHAYANAGYIGIYMGAQTISQRFDDFGGGTVVTAGGGLGAKRQASSTGRRRNMQKRNSGLIIL
jgi:hypothetical protein